MLRSVLVVVAPYKHDATTTMPDHWYGPNKSPDVLCLFSKLMT